MNMKRQKKQIIKKKKQGKKRNVEIVSFRKRLTCVSFSSCSGLAKSSHKVSMYSH